MQLSYLLYWKNVRKSVGCELMSVQLQVSKIKKQELAMKWLENSLNHVEQCDDELCNHFWDFQQFLKENNVEYK